MLHCWQGSLPLQTLFLCVVFVDDRSITFGGDSFFWILLARIATISDGVFSRISFRLTMFAV